MECRLKQQLEEGREQGRYLNLDRPQTQCFARFPLKRAYSASARRRLCTVGIVLAVRVGLCAKQSCIWV